MDDISNRLGISKKTLYQHVSNKEDLVDLTIVRHIQEEENLLKHLREQAPDAIHEMVQLAEYLIMNFSGMIPSFTHDLQKYYPKSWERVEVFHGHTVSNFIKKNLTRGIQQGYYRPDIDEHIISAIYLSLSSSVTKPEFIENQYFNIEKIILQHTKYHLYGILSDKGRTQLKAFKLFDR
jgi:AcrR family transcriptional regulator